MSNEPNREISLAEINAVRRRYAKRKLHDARYSLLNSTALAAIQERQRAMISMLRQMELIDVASLTLVEVGSGSGGNLLELLRVGFEPHRLTGIELLPERHAVAQNCLPTAVHLMVGDATILLPTIPSTDIVFQATVFSSLLDDAFEQRLAKAMWAAVKPGGAVLWYDFTVNNPRNPDVRGVPLTRVRELFPKGRITHRRLTLAPPIARAVTRLHPGLYTVFNVLPLLRTHVLCWIQKP